MATQKDVADRAGVSFITVSRVINNLGNVRPETRAKVEEAVRELQYHPNRQAQALNHGLTHTLGLVTPRMFDRPLWDNFYIMNLLSGVEMRGRELGWDVLITTDFDQEGDFDFLRVWHQRKVDGMIFVGLKRFPGEQIREIEHKGIACVSISDRIASPAVSWVDTRNDEAAAEAVRRLAALGHRHLAFLGVDGSLDYNPNFRDRELAVRTTAAELGLTLDVFASGTIESTLVWSPQSFLAKTPRATGIVAGNDSVAISFMAVLAQAGLQCPRDYSIVGFDAEPAGRLHSPPLASFRQPLVEMGQAAVSLLVNQLTGVQRAKIEKAFPLEFVDGQSLAGPPS